MRSDRSFSAAPSAGAPGGAIPAPAFKRAMRRKAARKTASPTTVLTLRLYIANNAPNSVQAVANLEAICKQYLKDAFKLEIIDVLEYPQRALADGVIVTPSLSKIAPSPGTRVVGNLSDKRSVLRALGIRG
jgi:circadian clock protein KaiB